MPCSGSWCGCVPGAPARPLCAESPRAAAMALRHSRPIRSIRARRAIEQRLRHRGGGRDDAHRLRQRYRRIGPCSGDPLRRRRIQGQIRADPDAGRVTDLADLRRARPSHQTCRLGPRGGRDRARGGSRRWLCRCRAGSPGVGRPVVECRARERRPDRKLGRRRAARGRPRQRLRQSVQSDRRGGRGCHRLDPRDRCRFGGNRHRDRRDFERDERA